ncbi:MAG: thiol-disulfide oxidoreductase DCC family protein [Fimbriimonas sp.]
MDRSVWKLYYDGGCNLCHASQIRAVQWAARAHQPMEAMPLQSHEAIEKGYADAMVLERDGKVYQAVDAWMEILDIAPWYLRWVRSLKKTAPTRSLLRWGYGVVARYRLKWFGTRECQIPTRR